MQRRLLLDVVVRQRAAVFQLLAGEDQALLVWWDALFVLDFGLHVVDGVRGLHFQGDGFAREGLDEAGEGLVSWGGGVIGGCGGRTSALGGC